MSRNLTAFLILVLAGLGCDKARTTVPNGGGGGGGGAGQVDAGPRADSGTPTSDGGVGSDAGTTDAGMSMGMGCDGFISEICAWATRCEAKLGFVGVVTEGIACHPLSRGELCADAEREAQLGLRMGMEVSQACLDGIRNLPCEEPDANAFFPACNDFFGPGRSPGQACYEDQHCIAGRCQLDNQCPGTCVALGTNGAQCEQDDYCAPELRCVNGACAARLTAGAACQGGGFTNNPCLAGMYCEPNAPGVNDGTCQPRGSAGDPCFPTNFTPTHCEGNLVCTEGVCGPGGNVNSACSQDRPCAVGLRCSEAEVCVPLSGPGESCAAPVQCSIGNACINGTCGAWAVVGESCSTDVPCFEGSCVNGTCAWLQVGDACTGETDRECQNARCRNDVCTAFAGQGDSCTDARCGPGLECGDNQTCEMACEP